MRRALDIVIAWFIGLAAIAALAMLMTGCGPTAPDPLTIRFYGVTISAEDQAWTYGEVLTQYTCVAPHRDLGGEISVEGRQGPFTCGGILVHGCQISGDLKVNVEVYRPAVSHELIHFMMMLNGEISDYKHESPVWARCDRLNRGGGE